MKKPDAILLILVLTVVALVGYQIVASQNRDSEELNLLKQQVSLLSGKIEANGKALAALSENELAEREEAARYHQDVVDHVKNITGIIPAQAQTLPMTEAIAKTRDIIQDGGVDAVDNGVMFTEPAFRANLRELLRGQEFSLALADSQKEVESLRFSLAIKDQKEVLYQSTIESYKKIVVAKDGEIKVYKKAGNKKVIKGGVVGAILGVLLTLLLK